MSYIIFALIVLALLIPHAAFADPFALKQVTVENRLRGAVIWQQSMIERKQSRIQTLQTKLSVLNSRLRIATPLSTLSWARSIIQVGAILQLNGYYVDEHPMFGGVAPVHVYNSCHYRASALDVKASDYALDRAYSFLRYNPRVGELIWRAPGHYNHLHVAVNCT